MSRVILKINTFIRKKNEKLNLPESKLLTVFFVSMDTFFTLTHYKRKYEKRN